jgi:hypothetical protein
MASANTNITDYIKIFISHTAGPEETVPCMEDRVNPGKEYQSASKMYYGSGTGGGIGDPSLISAFTDGVGHSPIIGDFVVKIIEGDTVIVNFRISPEMIIATMTASRAFIHNSQNNVCSGGGSDEYIPPPPPTVTPTYITFVTSPNAMGDIYELRLITRDLHRFPGHPVEVEAISYKKL